MGEILEGLYKIATNNFYKLRGIVATIILIFIVALFVYQLIPEGVIYFKYYFIFIGLAIMASISYWLVYVFYYQKRQKNKLGIVIAIDVENPSDYNYYLNDFLKPFKSQILDLELPFHVISLKRHQTKNIESKDDVRAILKKTKAHFCVWGEIKQRNLASGNSYVFLMKGSVIHKPIHEIQKILLEKDFEALLPHETLFEKSLQYQEFKGKAGQLCYAVKFIIGRAALLSGDFDIAIQLHEALLKEIDKNQDISINRDILTTILSLEYDLRSSFEYFTNGASDGFKKATDKALEYDPNNYGALLKKAIFVFDEGRGEKEDCIRILNRARSNNLGTNEWRYSKAFIYFWYEDYDNALKCCIKIKEGSYVNEEIAINEIIKFNEKLLVDHDRPQLYYWIGFISFSKGSIALADTYFQRYIEADTENLDKALVKNAKKYIKKIKEEINY